jgi:hypothetical protein
MSMMRQLTRRHLCSLSVIKPDGVFTRNTNFVQKSVGRQNVFKKLKLFDFWWQNSCHLWPDPETIILRENVYVYLDLPLMSLVCQKFLSYPWEYPTFKLLTPRYGHNLYYNIGPRSWMPPKKVWELRAIQARMPISWTRRASSTRTNRFRTFRSMSRSPEFFVTGKSFFNRFRLVLSRQGVNLVFGGSTNFLKNRNFLLKNGFKKWT